MRAKINTLKPFLPVLLIVYFSLFVLISRGEKNKQDFETISKDALQKAASIKTGIGLDYFKPQPNNELTHINRHTLNDMVSRDDISVLLRM